MDKSKVTVGVGGVLTPERKEILDKFFTQGYTVQTIDKSQSLKDADYDWVMIGDWILLHKGKEK